MHASGYSVAAIAGMLDRSEATVAKVVADHRQAQRATHAEEYEAMFKAAAKVAAANGDHKPALEWLDRYGAIPETSRQRTAIHAAQVAAAGQVAVTRHLNAAASPTIQIGIAMPGQLPVSSTSSQVSENFTLAPISGENMRHVARVSSSDDAK